MASRNARIGLVLFTIYLLFYGGFVAINAFTPEEMEKTPFAGLNLAIVYGFALILAAFALALVYGLLCKRADDADAPSSEVSE
jgi:uncharacterized membrane protein (DUF485 family)